MSSDGLEYLQQIWRNNPLLTDGELAILAKKARCGDVEAQQKLIESNLRLIAQHARKWRGKGIVSPADLVQTAVEQLMRKIHRFNPAEGAFSTWAVPIIDQAMQRLIDTQGTSIPLSTREGERIRRTTDEIDQTYDLLPLDAPFNGDSRDCYADQIEDRDQPSPHGFLEEWERSQTIDRAVRNLPAREQAIVRLYFLNDNGLTLEQIGQLLRPKVTKARVRQLKDQALEMLRTSPMLTAYA